MDALLERWGFLAEGAGATPLATYLTRKVKLPGKEQIVAMISWGTWTHSFFPGVIT